MLFDLVKLSKKSWHWRLQNWAFFGKLWESYPMNFCPYFWTVVFTIITLPIIAVVHLVIYLIVGLAFITGKMSEWWDVNFTKPCFERSVEKLDIGGNDWFRFMVRYSSDILEDVSGTERHLFYEDRQKELCKKYDIVRFEKKISASKRDLFLEWEKRTPDWKDVAKKVAQKRLKQVEEREAAMEKLMLECEKREAEYKKKNAGKIKRKAARRNAIVKWTSKIVPALLGSAIIFGLYKFVMWSTTWDWNKIGNGTLKFLVFVLTVAVTLGVIYLIVKLFKNFIFSSCSVDRFWSPIGRPIGNFFRAIGKFLYKALLKPVGRFLALLWTMFFSWKKDNCPGIEWD